MKITRQQMRNALKNEVSQKVRVRKPSSLMDAVRGMRDTNKKSDKKTGSSSGVLDSGVEYEYKKVKILGSEVNRLLLVGDSRGTRVGVGFTAVEDGENIKPAYFVDKNQVEFSGFVEKCKALKISIEDVLSAVRITKMPINKTQLESAKEQSMKESFLITKTQLVKIIRENLQKINEAASLEEMGDHPIYDYDKIKRGESTPTEDVIIVQLKTQNLSMASMYLKDVKGYQVDHKAGNKKSFVYPDPIEPEGVYTLMKKV